jgi:hypothetical protein
MSQTDPQFQLHDRHPALHGVAVLILALLFVAAFLATMAPGSPGPSPGADTVTAPAPGARAATAPAHG